MKLTNVPKNVLLPHMNTKSVVSLSGTSKNTKIQYAENALHEKVKRNYNTEIVNQELLNKLSMHYRRRLTRMFNNPNKLKPYMKLQDISHLQNKYETVKQNIVKDGYTVIHFYKLKKIENDLVGHLEKGKKRLFLKSLLKSR